MEINIIDIVKGSKVKHPVFSAAEEGHRYWNDFFSVVQDYKGKLTNKEFVDFLNKSKLNNLSSSAEYLQFASEATVVDYVIRKFSKFKNEPAYNESKNPECSFEYDGRIVNIEVKCPDLMRRIKQENETGIKVLAAERMPNIEVLNSVEDIIRVTAEGKEDVTRIERLDNKLKDYLLSAHAKFPKSDSKYFNILVVALDIIPDMDEWYGYLFGEKGAFTEQSYVMKCIGTGTNYENVDAVLLTNVQSGHWSHNRFPDCNCWHLENYVSLLFLNPQKLQDTDLRDYYFQSAIKIFGNYTSDFLLYLNKLDDENEAALEKFEKNLPKETCKEELLRQAYVNDRIRGLQLIQEWLGTLSCRIKK